MPTCRPSQLKATVDYRCGIHNAASKRRHFPHAKPTGCRYASAAAALSKPEVNQPTNRKPVRTLLYKTESFLPRVLTNNGLDLETHSLDFWQGVLSQTYERLNESGKDNAARIVVYGCDEYSGTSALVTAFLEEPFTSESQKQRIRQRWKGAEDEAALKIRYTATQSPTTAEVPIPSSWLQQFSVPVELHELRPSNKAQDPPTTLFAADIPIIVCNPISIPLGELLENKTLPLSHANAILAFVALPHYPPGMYKALVEKLPKTLTVVFVDPTRALGALAMLASDPSSSFAVQRYQDEYTGSRITDLTTAIARKLSEASQGDLDHLRESTAYEQINTSLEACREVLEKAEHEVGSVVNGVLGLRDKVAELETRFGAEVLGTEGSATVEKAITQAKKEVKVVFDQLTLWTAVSRVDELGEVVRTAVRRAWCRDLEDQLIYHSGRLEISQGLITRSTRKLLQSYQTPSAFYSPVLQNSLQQIQSSTSYPLKPSLLTAPIHNRLAQLSHPINVLHSAAQQVALGTGTSILGGIGIAWAGWAEHLGALGGLAITGMGVQTAIGSGLLVTALGLRWMIAKWEKAKRRWWRDWDRVGQGLERDLRTTLERTIAQQVVIVPVKACEGLSQMAEKKKEEIEALKDELLALQEEAK